MPYKVFIGPMTVECTTAEEVLALVTAERVAEPSQKPSRRQAKSKNHKGFTRKHKKALTLLIEGISGDELSTKMRFKERQAFAGFMSGLRTEAAKAGFNRDDFVLKVRKVKAGKWVSDFSVNPKYVDQLRVMLQDDRRGSGRVA